jgi:hypothetical protein
MEHPDKNLSVVLDSFMTKGMDIPKLRRHVDMILAGRENEWARKGLVQIAMHNDPITFHEGEE